MPLYHFVLKTDHDHIPDRDGSEWPNEAAAHEEAVLVAHDLMRNQRRVNTRAWSIEIRDDDLRPCSEQLFAEVDETIAHFPPELRETLIISSRRIAACFDTVLAARRARAQISKTLNRTEMLMTTIAAKRG